MLHTHTHSDSHQSHNIHFILKTYLVLCWKRGRHTCLSSDRQNTWKTKQKNFIFTALKVKLDDLGRINFKVSAFTSIIAYQSLHVDFLSLSAKNSIIVSNKRCCFYMVAWQGPSISFCVWFFFVMSCACSLSLSVNSIIILNVTLIWSTPNFLCVYYYIEYFWFSRPNWMLANALTKR